MENKTGCNAKMPLRTPSFQSKSWLLEKLCSLFTNPFKVVERDVTDSFQFPSKTVSCIDLGDYNNHLRRVLVKK